MMRCVELHYILIQLIEFLPLVTLSFHYLYPLCPKHHIALPLFSCPLFSFHYIMYMYFPTADALSEKTTEDSIVLESVDPTLTQDPSFLLDVNSRIVVPHINLQSHVLFCKRYERPYYFFILFIFLILTLCQNLCHFIILNFYSYLHVIFICIFIFVFILIFVLNFRFSFIIVTMIIYSEMTRLQNRIGELHLETEVERSNLKGLHKDRTRIKKDKQARQADIIAWEIKCNNIQMLKFGRLIDVEALENGSDRSKEIEAEKTVKIVEDDSRLSLYRLQMEFDDLKEKLAQVNTKKIAFLCCSVYRFITHLFSLFSLLYYLHYLHSFFTVFSAKIFLSSGQL